MWQYLCAVHSLGLILLLFRALICMPHLNELILYIAQFHLLLSGTFVSLAVFFKTGINQCRLN